MKRSFLILFCRLVLSSRHFKPLWFRTFRYLELSIETRDAPLVLRDIYAYFTAYPFVERVIFKSNDADLRRIWDIGWRTARLCAGETYYDCPYYEQLQYVGDTRIQSLISLYVSGDDRLMRNSITQFQQSVLPSGLTQGRYPSSQPLIIPPFSLFWVSMVHDYWMHRPDQQFVTIQLNSVKNVLNWYHQQVDKTEMLGPMDWWNFVDWPFGEWSAEKPVGGVPKSAINGHSAIVTLHYAYTLRMAAELFAHEGDDDQSKLYTQLANSLVKNTKALCWNAEKGLLADSPEQTGFSQHANILAVLTDMFDASTNQAVTNKVLKDRSLIQTTLYFKFYLVRAMNKAGLTDQYISQLMPWKKMISLGLTTFAETNEPTRSDCHAWSASPNYELLATVCGITPASAGFKTLTIAPHLGPLRFAKATMPHPNSDIYVSLTRKGKKGIHAEIVLPDSLAGNFVWADNKVVLHPGRQILRFN